MKSGDMLLLVRCNHCGNDQKTSPKGQVLTNKSKRCVYCGKTFKYYNNVNDNRLIKRLK